MKWVIQILCIGVLIAIWTPAYFAAPGVEYSMEVIPESEMADMPEPMEYRAMTPPPAAGSGATSRPHVAVIDSLAYEDERAAWQRQVDSLIAVQQNWMAEQRAAAIAAERLSFVGSANEWLTLICSLVSIITFAFQARDWRRNREA